MLKTELMYCEKKSSQLDAQLCQLKAMMAPPVQAALKTATSGLGGIDAAEAELEALRFALAT